TRFDEMRSVTATAIFRLGECYRKQGKTNEAVAQYQRLTREFRDQSTLATLSEQNLTGLGVATGPSQSQTFSERLAAAKRSSEAEDTSNGPNGASSSTESDEIKRIQAMVKDSPDLINARGIGGIGGRTPLHGA